MKYRMMLDSNPPIAIFAISFASQTARRYRTRLFYLTLIYALWTLCISQTYIRWTYCACALLPLISIDFEFAYARIYACACVNDHAPMYTCTCVCTCMHCSVHMHEGQKHLELEPRLSPSCKIIRIGLIWSTGKRSTLIQLDVRQYVPGPCLCQLEPQM